MERREPYSFQNSNIFSVRLHYSFNESGLTDDLAQDLLVGLEKASFLQELDLKNNFLTCLSAPLIRDLGVKLPLKTVRLSHNRIGIYIFFVFETEMKSSLLFKRVGRRSYFIRMDKKFESLGVSCFGSESALRHWNSASSARRGRQIEFPEGAYALGMSSEGRRRPFLDSNLRFSGNE